MKNTYGDKMEIDVVNGGFILSYPVDIEGAHHTELTREVFTSPRKLQQRIKELLEKLSFVAD